MHIYHKYTAGDIKGALEPQYKLNPVLLLKKLCSPLYSLYIRL